MNDEAARGGPGEAPRVEPSAPVRYKLAEDEIAARARATAALAAASTAMPPMLVLVLVGQARLAPMRLVGPVALLVVLLAIVRALAGMTPSRRRLRALEVRVANRRLSVETARGSVSVGAEDIARVVDIEGVLGGLRIELRPADDRPELVDVPRGGSGYGDLRAAIASICPVERGRRRRPGTRIALGLLVVLAIFFLPFFVDDVLERSRGVAVAVILVAWVAMRAALSRG